MVKSGHTELEERGFRNRVRPALGIEVLSFETLKDRVPREFFAAPHRLDFHQITLVTEGTGIAMIDFVNHSCSPGTLLHTRPGQVQCLPLSADGTPAALRATVVLFTAGFPPPVATTATVVDDPFGRQSWDLAATDRDVFERALAELTRDYDAITDANAAQTTELLRHLLAALLIRIARLEPAAESHSGPDTTTYSTFRHELERSFAVLHTARDYAIRLGHSQRTLNRACLDETGHTAKQLIDKRIALEAKRLLVHTDLPVATITRRLGFTEPTNFVKFFARTAHTTPAQFRRAERGDRPAQAPQLVKPPPQMRV